MNNIGARIKEIRLELKLTQKEFGEKLSISQDTISLWETGKSLPTAEFLILMNKVFGISADYILCLTEY